MPGNLLLTRRLSTFRRVVCSIFLTLSSSLLAQNHTIDSLRNVLRTAKEDTNKVNTLISFTRKLLEAGNFDTALTCAKSAQSLAEQLAYKRGIAGAISNIGITYWYLGNYAMALEYDNKALALNQELGNKKWIAGNLRNIGIINDETGNYQEALNFYSKALAMDQVAGNGDAIASDIGNMGIVYHEQGNYPKALECDFKVLAINQQSGDKDAIASDYCNLANVYDDQANFTNALDYDIKGLALYRMQSDKNGMSTCMGNIAIIYDELNKFNMAVLYCDSALVLARQLGHKRGVARNLNNLGNIYHSMGDNVKAIEYYNQGLAMDRELGNEKGIAINQGNMGDIFIREKNYKLAKMYLDSSLALTLRLGDKNVTKDNYEWLSQLDSATGDFKRSLEDYKKHIIYRDSLMNEANTKKSVQAQMNYEFEQKQSAEKAEQDKKDAVAEQDRNKQKVIRNSFIAGFALMLALAFFIFRGYRQKQKANEVITQQKEEVEMQKTLVEQQKAIVEEKNKDILDSITYAKRLQDAILPPLSTIKQYLPESFVLYKPKDIVAGDFYWVAPISPEGGVNAASSGLSPLGSGGAVLIAAADCTGHGVPGALVSVVCSNALNRTVKEFKITEPGKILDKVRELVLETFEKSEDNVQDGMDISLCALTLLSPKGEGVTDTIIGYSSTAATTDTSLPKGREGVRVSWAGANNSLWYILNGEMMEIAPDKQPIGKYYNAKAFTTHTFTIPKISPLGSGGAMLYLFTDGYADQFGGEKGKKFKYKQMQQLIMESNKLTMEEQKRVLEDKLNEWKGNLEQVDDVLVIGIRI